MATQRITVEVDEETARGLGALGDPGQVLAQLATAATAAAAKGGHLPHREQTDTSLRLERHQTDARLASRRATDEARADEVVRRARERADALEEGAEARARRGPREGVQQERADADRVVEQERAGDRRGGAGELAAERQTTDKDLGDERVVADSALGDLREVNEQMVGLTLRAQDLAEEAEKKARELSVVAEFREMFIGILGHDLRTPLSAINVSAGMMLRRAHLDEQDQRLVARIISSSQRMSRMITQLLDLTRARLGGGLPLARKPTDLSELCQAAADELDARIDVVADGDLTGNWDADRLAEALSNLLGNAVEYAAPGTAVTLEARADGDQVVVEVKNQGEPIPPAILPFIFEPFRRGKQQEKSPSGNLGLGLYIAKQTLLAHGGTLEARSQGGTTSFVMRLPRTPPPG